MYSFLVILVRGDINDSILGLFRPIYLNWVSFKRTWGLMRYALLLYMQATDAYRLPLQRVNLSQQALQL